MKDEQAIAVRLPAVSDEVIRFAAGELADGLRAMLGGGRGSVAVIEGDLIAPADVAVRFVLQRSAGGAKESSADAAADDSFAISRRDGEIVLEAQGPRGLLHSSYHLLELLGARFPMTGAPQFPRIDRARLLALKPCHVAPAFKRRRFVSDIMTWNYTDADRLQLHLGHDREFIPWMSRHGINAFSYIRHATDSRLRIEEIAPLYRERGIEVEYGGHVLQLLLPRERFESDPDYFPVGADGKRMACGNLCVSNHAAMEMVRANALKYVTDYPENRLLHVWGADVFGGAWCRCGGCAGLSPPLQYMKVVNAIAEAIADGTGASGPPVAYLAYHDTIEPDPRLEPGANVWFEWAPRERCYSHAINDPACETNPRYLESLKRYLELFDGRGHVFEYYADAILFGGIGFARPSTIARDLRAYHALGLRSISCLTFGAFSVLAYPVNLMAFVRGSRDPGFDPDTTLADAVAERHPGCAAEMTAAYRAIERASALVLTYGDVMRPRIAADAAARKRTELASAVAEIRIAIEAAEHVLAARKLPLVAAERELWEYGLQTLTGIVEYSGGTSREAAIGRIESALGHIRAIEPEIKGNWGAYDIDRFHQTWLGALRRGQGSS